MKTARRSAFGPLRIITTLFCAVVAGCAAVPADADDDGDRRPHPVSSYPDSLSVSARYVYERYRSEEYPLAFVVAPDGGYATYWRCNGPNCRLDDEVYIARAMNHCISRSHHDYCLVHSIRKEVVWPKPTRFDSDIRSRLVVPWRHRNQGAEKAIGAIVHVPGFAGHRYPPALDHPIAPYYLRILNQAGYDTFRLNIAHFDYSRTDHLELSAKIQSTVTDLRQRGYRKVFLNGQSRGAWEILAASAHGLGIDGAMLFVPAAHGRATRWDGKPNPRYSRSVDDFRDLTSKIGPYRFLFTFFTGDEYDPGNRVETLTSIARQDTPHFVLDRPRDLAGHGAAGRIAFQQIYGDCLEQFLDGQHVDFGQCGKAFFPKRDLDISTPAHLFALGAAPVEGDELKDYLKGRAFYPLVGNPGWWGYHARADGTLLQWFPGEFLTGNTLDAEWQADAGRFCVVGSPRLNRERYCYAIFKMPSGNTGFVAPDGLAFVARSIRAPGPEDLPFRPGDWMGEDDN